LLNSFFNIFQNENSDEKFKNNDSELTVVAGLLIEAASIDGVVDKSEIMNIENSISDFFNIDLKKSNNIVKNCLENINNSNSFHFYTSQINSFFEYEKKIKIIEILWEVVLADGKIHDYESSLIRRLTGLLYIKDFDSGNAKKKVLEKINKNL
tara:strand:- start:11584 stop:12042 length:459 start_codon:yes stop_codon:yes gene_type:complete